MKPVHTPTVVAIACVVYGVSILLHEVAHAVVALVRMSATGRP